MQTLKLLAFQEFQGIEYSPGVLSAVSVFKNSITSEFKINFVHIIVCIC